MEVSVPDNSKTDGGAESVFDRFNPGAVPPDHDAPIRDADKGEPEMITPSPDIEAGPEQDPQAPDRNGEG
jgi:hypothetical protein